jgi:hypothetical protein
MPAKIRIRQIVDADVPEVVNLLARGFGRERTRAFWKHVLDCLGRRSVPPGYPRYGCVLASDGKLVGVLIEITSIIRERSAAKIRCNGSSFYVDPAFRFYAQLLVSRALKYKNITVLDITSAPHTRTMIETLGFIRYSDGVLVAVPLLSPPPKDIPVGVIDAHDLPDVPFDPHERDLLLEHAEYGCTSLWCIAHQQAYPFVFRLRMFKLLRCAQLVYCRDIDSFVQFARPIGLHLARKLRLFVMLDSNGPIPGLVGRYYFGETPRYFYGPDRPRMGDLAYTETSMFGI